MNKKFIFAFLSFFITVFSTFYVYPSKATDDVLVHFIDVGQGDSELIVTKKGTVLIDGGEQEHGEDLVKYLKNQKIKKIDVLVATHPHSDHIGGLSDVVKNFEVGVVYLPNAVSTTKTFENFIDLLKEKKIKVKKAKAPDSFSLDTVKFEIVAPNSDKYDNLNNYSVCIKMTHGKNKFLFTGDAEKLSENEMLAKKYDLKVDVLKVGHHGSTTSSSLKFIKAVSPSIAVISVGKDNDYKHPHPKTLDTLNKEKITIYRTDKDGTVVLLSSKDGIFEK